MAALPEETARETFSWAELRIRLDTLAQTHTLAIAADRKALVVARDGQQVALVTPPVLLPIRAHHASVADYGHDLPAQLGRQLVLLLRAGSAALGVWHEDEIVLHKVIKKYVVRGHGKAQTTYRKTKGKSRAGSRLRLRNAQTLLDDVNERLRDWRGRVGDFDRILYYCPPRQWPELFAATPPPPFPDDDPRLTRVPFHVHEPGFDELLHVRRRCTRGAIQWIVE